MNDTRDLFQKDFVPLPEGFNERVFLAITILQKRKIRNQKIMWSVFGIVSATAFIASNVTALHQIQASNFGTYFSIIFSDTGSVSTFWKELGMTLIESMPILAFASVIATLSFMILSARKIFKPTNNFYELTV